MVLIGLIFIGVISLPVPHQTIACDHHCGHEQQAYAGADNHGEYWFKIWDLRAQWANAGRSTAFVDDIMLQMFPWGTQFGNGDMFPPPGTREQITEDIGAGKRFQLRGGGGFDIPETCINPDGTIRPFQIYFSTEYDTMHLHVTMRTTWEFQGGKHDEEGRAAKHPHPNAHEENVT